VIADRTSVLADTPVCRAVAHGRVVFEARPPHDGIELLIAEVKYRMVQGFDKTRTGSAHLRPHAGKQTTGSRDTASTASHFPRSAAEPSFARLMCGPPKPSPCAVIQSSAAMLVLTTVVRNKPWPEMIATAEEH
jgi:hypothetical protein